MVLDFKETLAKIDSRLLKFDKLETLQVNLGNKCNQSCVHCHVGAGPGGQKIMSRDVMLKIIDFLQKHGGLVVDVTGGCPELNPDFRFFIDSVYELSWRLMVRTNLTVFFEPALDWVSEFYSQRGVVLIASLPCYTEENVDKQRGEGVFKKSIAALKMLNELGYGGDQGLELNLVYNPGADFLPGSQEQLEAAFKRELGEKYAVCFNKLFTITNAPIGRFRQQLEVDGRLEPYLKLLAENFNPDAAERIMCRNLVSVDHKGVLYNCDFNQALRLPVVNAVGCSLTIQQLEDILSRGLEIITGKHCFCCTAGAGSSCTGSLVKQKP
ncbi:MAG: arsenosugar biosynthesis radical SAM (seleno)protein ArsS [Sedimentisphaerales bacterium]